ncbi:inorganic diphosphatase [Puia sp. P3]|uniref:inorganic diphosphatase n=1 Tax=Puia sp. P3 TaxID=3423952 RepID=UPI003D67B073
MSNINVVIETPKGSAQKYDFEPGERFFKLKKILPSGMVFPYDFGFIPNTEGEDGDPLDVIVISEFHSLPGIMMKCRVLGGICAEQSDGKGARWFGMTGFWPCPSVRRSLVSFARSGISRKISSRNWRPF